MKVLAGLGRRNEARAMASEALALADGKSTPRTPFLSRVLAARANNIAAVAAGAEGCQFYRTSLKYWDAVRADKSYTAYYERERQSAVEGASRCK